MPKVVCNSSPLIRLSKAGRLSLLRDFFQEILVPREVLTESVENSGGAKDAKEIKEADWIHPLSIEDTDLKKALKMTLDDGEAAAIVLALEQQADIVLMDDSDGRAVAMGVPSHAQWHNRHSAQSDVRRKASIAQT